MDEIQKCENWSETLKTLYDESKRKKRSPRCVVLGSSSLELSKGLTESLTGRFQLTQAYHWNYEESKISPLIINGFFKKWIKKPNTST